MLRIPVLYSIKAHLFVGRSRFAVFPPQHSCELCVVRVRTLEIAKRFLSRHRSFMGVACLASLASARLVFFVRVCVYVCANLLEITLEHLEQQERKGTHV